jgi:hypothetical protein
MDHEGLLLVPITQDYISSLIMVAIARAAPRPLSHQSTKSHGRQTQHCVYLTLPCQSSTANANKSAEVSCMDQGQPGPGVPLATNESTVLEMIVRRREGSNK